MERHPYDNRLRYAFVNWKERRRKIMNARRPKLEYMDTIDYRREMEGLPSLSEQKKPDASPGRWMMLSRMIEEYVAENREFLDNLGEYADVVFEMRGGTLYARPTRHDRIHQDRTKNTLRNGISLDSQKDL